MTHKKFSLTLGALALLAFSGHAEEASLKVTEVAVKRSKPYMKSLKKFPVCDLKTLGDTLASGNNLHKTAFFTKHITDNEAGYDFYAASESSQLNADRIRHVTCKHIMENKCRVFWGNVLNMAYIAEKPVASFPADTTPHYMLSPKITCDKFDFKKIEKRAAAKSAGKTLKMTPDMKKERIAQLADMKKKLAGELEDKNISPLKISL